MLDLFHFAVVADTVNYWAICYELLLCVHTAVICFVYNCNGTYSFRHSMNEKTDSFRGVCGSGKHLNQCDVTWSAVPGSAFFADFLRCFVWCMTWKHMAVCGIEAETEMRCCLSETFLITSHIRRRFIFSLTGWMSFMIVELIVLMIIALSTSDPKDPGTISWWYHRLTFTVLSL